MGGTFPLVRLGIGLVAASGASKIISDAVKHVAVVETNAQMVRVMVGSMALGAMVGDAAGKFTQTQIDILHEAYQTLKNKTNPDDPQK